MKVCSRSVVALWMKVHSEIVIALWMKVRSEKVIAVWMKVRSGTVVALWVRVRSLSVVAARVGHEAQFKTGTCCTIGSRKITDTDVGAMTLRNLFDDGKS